MPTKTTDIETLETEINALVQDGKILDAIARYYSADCEFQEGLESPRVGRSTQEAHLTDFFSSLEEFKGATLHSQGCSDDVTLSEWTFEMVGPDGPIIWNEVLRRHWRDGKVVSERYYMAD